MKDPKLSNFLTIFKKFIFESQRILITSHINADADALASCYGVKFLIESILKNNYKNSYHSEYIPTSIKDNISLYENSINFTVINKELALYEVNIILPQLNRLSDRIIKNLSDLEKPKKDWPSEIDLLIVLDTPNLGRTEMPYGEKWDVSWKKLVIIDHHNENLNFSPRLRNIDNVYDKITIENSKEGYLMGDSKYNLLIFQDPNSPSTSELIAKMLKKLNLIPNRVISTLLIKGIVSDTALFRYARPSTFEIMQFLLINSENYSDIIISLDIERDHSEKIARIKAAQRIKNIYRINDALVIISHVSSYEGSAAHALVELGADLSFIIVLNKKTYDFRISARGNSMFIKRNSFHLGDFLTEFAEKYDGQGGGHDGAAGCYGKYSQLDKRNNRNLTNKEPSKIIDNLEKSLIKHLRKTLKPYQK